MLLGAFFPLFAIFEYFKLYRGARNK
jgi:hypothetical protein